MFETLIGIVFLALIITPIAILFIALYQNLIEIAKPKPKIRQTTETTAGRECYYTDSKEIPAPKLRVVK